MPDITAREIKYVNRVLKSGNLSIGPIVKEFEKAVEEFSCKKHAVAVNSGTSALHLCMRALGISDGDEVITTPFSFIASANCILMERAVPVFADIDPHTLNIDIDRIEEKITPRTKAILPVDIFGQPLDMKAITTIAQKHGLKVVEDACEALGSEFNGIKAGTLCDAGVYGFYPNKQITTAEGGIIVTDDDTVAELCRSMRSQGRPLTELWLEHERLGYNYRQSELHAALGVAQMERIREILEKRRKVAERYERLLSGVQGLELPYVSDGVSRMSWFVYVVRLAEGIDRRIVMDTLISRGIECRAYFTPIHLQPFYKEGFGYKEGDFPVTEDISSRTVALPFFNDLTDKQAACVAENLADAVGKSLK